ncbi:MAG TPA: zinc ribbon domain-containing protein [Candidatus Lokiarchaeia archaeon]|nr:zinc ribbon domain-containing protein [Candidatus Lokiarchaeia archaeon]
MYNPNPNQYRPVLNPFQKLGKRFRTFAIISLIYTLLAVVGVFDPTGASTILAMFLAFVVFIYQILIIIDAKKAAKLYNRPALNQFGTYLIIYIIISFVSVAITYFPIMMATATSGLLDTTPYSLTGAIGNICSIAFQLMAWLSMATFFRTTEAIDIQARSMNWTKLIIIAILIELGAAIAIEIPLSIIESVIDLGSGSSVNTSPTLELLDAVCLVVWNLIALFGYFKIGEVFYSLGTIESPEVEQPSTGMPSPGTSSFSRAPSGNFQPGPMRNNIVTCPYCGTRFQADPSMEFCPSCGSRFNSTR